MPNDFKTIVQRNLASAIFDARSSVDEKPLGSFAWKQNVAVSPDGRLCRALGWQRLYSQNLDYHTQSGTREPITMLFPSTSNEGVRRLFGATKTKILVMNEAAGTWDVIGSGFGADGLPSLTQVRFHAAELQNKVVFTNNFDPPKIYDLPATGVTTAGTSVGAIASLLDLNGNPPNTDTLTKAKAIVSWQGFVFFGNTFEDGVRYASRIRWCHLNLATAWKEGVDLGGDLGDSLADFQDLTYGDEILALIPLGSFLYAFTNRGIERLSISVNFDAVLTQSVVTLLSASVYREPETQAKCLAYPNAVISDGGSFWYAGRDGIYRFTPGQDAAPERVEWVHRSTSVTFKDAATRINSGACESPVMVYHPASNEDDTAGGEIHFSWPHEDTGINNSTLVIANRKSADLNNRYQTTDFREYGSTAMVNFRSDLQGIGACNQLIQFISANGEDFCLKELDAPVGSREMFSPPTGLYSLRGYYSILRGVMPFEVFDKEKEIQSFLIEHEAVDPLDAAVFRLSIGSSDQAIDPNPNDNGNCHVLWLQLRDIPIKCGYRFDAATYIAKKQKPANPVCWSALIHGRYIFYELTIAAADNSAPKDGLLSLSHLEVSARLV